MATAKVLAQGALHDDGVLVADVAQANRLHNKAIAGTPQSGNHLRLSLVEAAHCVASGWLAVDGGGGQPMAAADVLATAKAGHRVLTDYLVYRDLRERGFVARHAAGTSHFDIWPRGKADGPPQWQTVACSTDDSVRTSDLVQAAGGVVCSVVDDDSAVTHYQLAFEHPSGKVHETVLPPATGRSLAGRVLVTDPTAAAAYSKEFLGTPGADGVFLSQLEAAALHARGVLHLPGAPGAQPSPEVLQTYATLRKAGVVVKSGFRFGAHLRGYVGAPDDSHAEWLLHCAKAGEHLPWAALSRGVRLAHGVRKQFLVAVPDGEAVSFVRLAWFRP